MIRALALDFLHPGARTSRLGPVLLMLGILAVGAAGYRYFGILEESGRLEDAVAASKRAARREAPPRREQDPKVLQEVAQANAVIGELAVPWDELFADLEEASLPGIALLSIQPNPSGRQVRITGEARRYEDALAYVERLEQREGLESVFLTGHEVRSNSPRRQVAFAIVADWVSAP